MSIPGFAAEASLYKPSQQYRAVESLSFGTPTGFARN